MTAARGVAANGRSNLGREQLDHAGDFRKRQAADVDLRLEALVAEQLPLIENLIDDLLRTADEQAAVRRGERLKIGPRDFAGAKLRWNVSRK